jgi:Bacterial nucleoid DNA-binding protein
MKKSDIIKQIDKYTNYSQKDIKLVIEYFLDAIMEGLIQDERIELRRLGIFY